jgi:acyl-coenzyme A synthetase/AMP-(fatty) acid ligase
MEIFNAADFLVDRHVRAGNGQRTAVLTAQRRLTYAELAEEVHRVAAGFAELGVRPEERVVF